MCFRETELVHYAESEEEEVYPDEDNEDDECNWRNDYPDEDPDDYWRQKEENEDSDNYYGQEEEDEYDGDYFAYGGESSLTTTKPEI